MEVMIALLILALGVVVFLHIQRMQNANVRAKRNMNQAVQLIEKTVEELRVNIAQDRTNNFPPHDTTIVADGASLKVIVSDAYDTFGDLTKNARQLDITATWTAASGAPQTMTLRTYIARDY